MTDLSIISPQSYDARFADHNVLCRVTPCGARLIADVNWPPRPREAHSYWLITDQLAIHLASRVLRVEYVEKDDESEFVRFICREHVFLCFSSSIILYTPAVGVHK